MAGTVFHCELAWLGAEAPAADVRIDVADGSITAITSGVPAPPGATRLAGITLPGLANAHSHAFHRALRSRTQAGSGTFWSWRDDMYRLAATLDPDSYHRLARATFAEMVLAGITCVGEFHYVHHALDGTPYSDPNAMGSALIDAASDAGLRLTLLDACYLGAGIEPDGTLRPVEGAQIRFSDRTVRAWSERAAELRARSGPKVRIGAAVHSVRAVDPASITIVADWAASRGSVLHAHVSEQQAENQQCLRAHGHSPVGLLNWRGAVTAAFTAVHATHVSDDDLMVMSRAGSGVCLCPTTERDLGDGIAPTARLREHDIATCVGSDSHAVIDLFEESRAVELGERLATGTRGNHRAIDLLLTATANGHRSLGWPELGRIEVGAPADLVSIRTRSVRTAGTGSEHALAAVVYAATAADVTDVVVGGEQIVRGGRHRTIDVDDELDAAVRAVWGPSG